ncbi:hypothetical protein FQN54_000060 [Arachnomyces sp. PD_36]|nr:hypothetical protein FQN54_000060 [Arachnomyces sp. PD_36]
MKWTALLTLITLTPTAFAATRFSKRDCVPTACSCYAVPNGLFCGDGLLDCTPGHVYQCDGDGKESCDYGLRDSCAECGELEC